ncbi:MAG: hypothetical protein L6Q71_11410, partial [Planctomycetes bacterium]|nr:hypothetical protein [Planctomycetota bacterium]
AAPKAPAGNKATDEFDKIAANKSKAVDDKIKALDNVGEIDAAAARGLAATFLKIESWVDHGRLANAIIDTLEAVTNADALKEFRQEMQRGADLHVRLRIAYFNAVANNDQSDDREAFLT